MAKPLNPKTASPPAGGGANTPHWLIEPTKAIIGFESILQNYATGSEGLWKQAWNDAVNGQIRGAGPAVAANELGLLMNSYGYRDQHQVGGGGGLLGGGGRGRAEWRGRVGGGVGGGQPPGAGEGAREGGCLLGG